jgi:hypothetical protein
MMDDDVGSYARGKTGDFYRPGRACRMLGASPRSKKRDEGGGAAVAGSRTPAGGRRGRVACSAPVFCHRLSQSGTSC